MEGEREGGRIWIGKEKVGGERGQEGDGDGLKEGVGDG